MPVNIFFCYAREDEVLLNKLKIHLRPLQREGLIDIWYDRDISAGTEWEQEIKQHLNSAQIIMLLISPDFMASDYCYSIEMKYALERHSRGEVKVLPIILRHVYWENAPFSTLQMLPKNAEPIMNWLHLDKAFYDVVKETSKAIKELLSFEQNSNKQIHQNTGKEFLHLVSDDLLQKDRTERIEYTSSTEEKTLGQQRFTHEELDKLALIKELIKEGGFSPNDILAIDDDNWREVFNSLRTYTQRELEKQANDLPVDHRIKNAREKLFWRFYASHALRLSLMLIGEDMPRQTVGLFLPLQPEAAHLPVTNIENIHLLGESLVGWLGHSRSTHTLLTSSPHFSFNSDYRIHPLRVMENNKPIEESSPDHTHVTVHREARALTLRPEVVETIRALLNPLYEDVERIRACFGQDMYDVLESSSDLDNTTMYPDIILNNLAEMIVQLGGSEQGMQRWLYCCILLTKDPSRPLQQRTLVVRAQSHASPHKVGVASVSPTFEMSILSLHAYLSGQVCYRDAPSLENSAVAFHDIEHNIQSAIAIPVGAEYGEPVAVMYIASEFDKAFSQQRDQRLLRLLGRMIGEALKTYQVRRQETEKLEVILSRPEVVDDVMGAFDSENDLIRELNDELLRFEAERQQLKQRKSKSATIDQVRQERYILSFIGVDIDHLSSFAAKYGNNAMRNLYREVAHRIQSELASTFRMYPESKFYYIYADRFVVLLKNITHEQLISKARLLKKSLDGAYRVSLLSTQQPLTVQLEELKITVRLVVSAYDRGTLGRLLDEYHGPNNANRVREAIENSLTTELKKGMSDGGNQIRAWNPSTHLYERLEED